MQPDLELVQIGHAQSFTAWEHGYPFHTVRWHFHPEYELHHVVATSGRCFVGDYIGRFAPGHLVLAGPNLPHNWVSDLAPGEAVALRGRVLQFGEAFMRDAAALLPELACFRQVLEASRRGLLFSLETAEAVGPSLEQLVGATGIRRIELFVSIVGMLSRAQGSRAMSSAAYHPDPPGFMATGINESLDYIRDHLTESFAETDLARICGLTPGAYSRSFRRHTGMALSRYVNRLRINLAIQLLMSEEALSVADVCFASGFTNLSNFNRQFLRQKGVPPSRFRQVREQGAAFAEAA